MNARDRTDAQKLAEDIAAVRELAEFKKGMAEKHLPYASDYWTTKEAERRKIEEAEQHLHVCDAAEALQTAETRIEELTEALGAYRSALRSGETESQQMKDLARGALAKPSSEGDGG